MEDTLTRSPYLGLAESMSTITGAIEGVLLGCSDTEIKNNSVGKPTLHPTDINSATVADIGRGKFWREIWWHNIKCHHLCIT